ncbi:Lrp/AsnC family transcriptional regulator [Halosegnis sp.]|uniref:Lrp/AsnC family transcriptional regulator n=1 Tax=Halosegnis sp. TaxID=2864959 RepID=UPI0035D437D1
MTVTAYVTVKAHTGDADRLREAIAGIEGVVDVDIVAGDVDFIAKVAVEGPDDVRDIAASKVRTLEGVEDTHTYIAMD